MTKREIWKPIPGYLNYKVSNLGRVKSIGRMDARGERRKGKILSRTMNPSGYMMVTLYEGGQRKTYTVHKLVASAFIGDRPNGTEVNHIDEDKTNNSADNLEYVTRLENVRHGTRTARASASMVNHPSKSAPVAQIAADGSVVAVYPSQHEAMRQTGVNNKNISQACLGEKHTAGGYRWERV